jgi:hypothetical protein
MRLGTDTKKVVLNVRGYDSLSPAAARILGNRTTRTEYRLDELRISGLTSLSEAVAAGLSQFRGKLVIGGVKELSCDAAWALAAHGDVLVLSDVQSVSGLVATALRTHRGTIEWPKLKQLSENSVNLLRLDPVKYGYQEQDEEEEQQNEGGLGDMTGFFARFYSEVKEQVEMYNEIVEGANELLEEFDKMAEEQSEDSSSETDDSESTEKTNEE